MNSTPQSRLRFYQDAKKHIENLSKQKPSRKHLAMIWKILAGIILILEDDDTGESDRFLRAVESIAKNYKQKKEK